MLMEAFNVNIMNALKLPSNKTTTTLLKSFGVAQRVYNSTNSPYHVSRWYKKGSQQNRTKLASTRYKSRTHNDSKP